MKTKAEILEKMCALFSGGARNIICALFLGAVILGATMMPAEARLAPAGVQYDRTAVVNEAYYALSGVPYSSSIGSSTWNYLSSDPGAYWHTRDYWTTRYPVNGYMTNANDLVLRNYFIAGNLPAYGRYNGYLRGGQCKYFANLLLYRAGVANVDPMPTYTTMATQAKSSSYAKPGDVLFRTNYHTAIVTRIISGNSATGTVTSVEVVDSNYVGGAGNERIGLHTFSGTTLTQYKVWTGVSYYKC